MEQKFESPIERKLYTVMSKLIRPDLSIETQVPILNYRVDMLIREPRVIVIECDGRDFHHFWQDRERDEDLIARGGVWQVMRFKGSDIFFGADRCVDEMRKVLPELFYEQVGELHEAIRSAAFRSWHGMKLQPILRGPGGDQHKSDYWNRDGRMDRVWNLGMVFEMMADGAQ